MDRNIQHHPHRRSFLTRCSIIGAGVTAGCFSQLTGPYHADAAENDTVPVDFSMVAYCALRCDKCEVYIATQQDDDEMRADVAKRWKMDLDKVNCNGCKAPDAMFNCSRKSAP